MLTYVVNPNAAVLLHRTLAAAKAVCVASDHCAGFCFTNYDREPAAGTVLRIMLKTIIDYVQVCR